MEEAWVFAYDHKIVRKKTENSIRKESYEKGLEAGIIQGVEHGEKNKQVEIAKSMLSDNIAVEKIFKYTYLTIEEIKQLKV